MTTTIVERFFAALGSGSELGGLDARSTGTA